MRRRARPAFRGCGRTPSAPAEPPAAACRPGTRDVHPNPELRASLFIDTTLGAMPRGTEKGMEKALAILLPIVFLSPLRLCCAPASSCAIALPWRFARPRDARSRRTGRSRPRSSNGSGELLPVPSRICAGA